MIQKEAKNKRNFISNKFFTKSARNALLHILRLQKKQGKILLLPSYIGINDYEGSGVFDAVQISRIPYQFYHISENLSPILGSIHIEKSKSYCLLCIHYFGFPADNFDEIKSFCECQNITLIEDCAHTLHGSYKNQQLGTFGKFSFHSIHKILPTDDGGLLVDNSDEINFNILPENEGIKQETLSTFSLALHNNIVQTRIENYRRYLALLEPNSKIIFMHAKLLEGVVPLNFPIRIQGGMRKKLYYDLIEKGITTAALYYRLIPQIDENRFEESHAISASILNLPVHQDTTVDHVEFICNTVNNLIKSY